MSGSVWGGYVAAPTRLQDVMDAELAVRLQREEQEQWEREIAGRFGAGWCFVEVPRAGGMGVEQQEISVGQGDADWVFALELEAQEAEEYSRLLRQQEASTERYFAIHEDSKDTLDASDGQLVVHDQSEEQESEENEWLKPLSRRRRHRGASRRDESSLHAKAKEKRSRRAGG